MSVTRAEGASSNNIVRSGYLKKLKTSKKKYFVLRAETADASAKLEYYDSFKKFNNGQAPKRSIPLRSCFNINKRHDIKQKHVIALYTKDDCFCIVLENEKDSDTWLRSLLSLQQGGEDIVDGEEPRPTFEHVWQVNVLNRGLGHRGFCGPYRLCLTDMELSLIKFNEDKAQVDLSLTNIRSCGKLESFFFLEVGRQSALGGGELWMQTEDNYIAQNVHLTVVNAMSNKDRLEPKSRNRSSSATEATKPSRGGRTNKHGGSSKSNLLAQGVGGGIRERCDSMPSRARTSSEGAHHQTWNGVNRTHLVPYRPTSLYSHDNSHSPPSGSPVSPPSACCSTDSAGSSYSLADEDTCPELLGDHRYGHSLTPDEAIAEEDCVDSPPENYVPMSHAHSSDDGYVDMSPRGRHHNSPTASLSSVTSGTPSTDMRFAEYPLEPVKSYFGATEEDDARPARAYSVGSRTDCYSKNDNLRVRAMSCGSKSKKLPSRIFAHHNHYVAPHTANHKSSSAPILSNSAAGRTRQGSYNSIGPMDDLMEMDFSNSRSGSINSGYLDMTPKNSGYVEMKPGVPSENKISRSKDNVSPYVDMVSGTSPSTRPSTLIPGGDHNGLTPDYMEMDGRKNNNNSINLNLNNQNNNRDYMDMSCSKKINEIDPNNYQLSPAKNSFLIGSPSGSIFNNLQQELTTVKPPDGYVEMSLGKVQSTHKRQSSLDSAQITQITTGSSSSLVKTPVANHNEDYANMTVGSASSKKRTNSKKKDKGTRSQPIAIQNPKSTKTVSNSSSPLYNILGRKFSTGTPPTMHLPLADSTPYCSLPRQRKNSRRDSKDSSSSSVTTPSSSSTIFPLSLNSPCSPIKPETTCNIKVPAAVLNTPYKKSQDGKKGGDYLPMDFGGGKKKTSSSSNDSDYVNYNPAPKKIPTKPVIVSSPVSREGDYAVMLPGLDSLLSNMSLDTESDTYERLRPGPTNPGEGSSGLIMGRQDSGGPTTDFLYYASLDLDDGNRSPRTVASDGLTYAAIDFNKSEGLKHNLNTKVKH